MKTNSTLTVIKSTGLKMASSKPDEENYPVLVLDGGGSKGVYTLGVLSEIEKQLNVPLHEHFKLVYGTSTGAIIAALIGLGKTVSEISEFYFKYIPQIMNQSGRVAKSKELARLCDQVFGEKSFSDFKTDVGIVAVNYSDKKPLVFKTQMKLYKHEDSTFVPGFGCSISDAVQASCSAFPIFDKKIIKSSFHGDIIAIDGGFLARNATLYALVDTQRLRIDQKNIEVLSLGTGKFQEKPLGGLIGILNYFDVLDFVKTLISSTNNANEELQQLLFKDVRVTRIDNAHYEPRYATNMIERNRLKLSQMYSLGKHSFKNSKWAPSFNKQPLLRQAALN